MRATKRRRIRMLLLATMQIVALSATGSAVAEDGDNAVLRWNEVFTRCVQRDMPGPCVTVRNLALMHLAIERALRDGAEREPSHRPFVASAAADEICRALFPSHTAEFDRVLEQERVSAGAEPLVTLTNRARATARQVLEWRSRDGAATDVHYIPDARPGKWQRTAPAFRPPEAPRWGLTTPFVLRSGTELRCPAPPPVSSEEYAAAFDEVRRLGGAASTERSDAETQVAKFWSDFSYTSTPPGHWNNIARDLVRARKLPLRETARLFAILNVAMADAGIAAWDTKYHYNTWRPATAVHRAAEDENAATVPEPEWRSLLPSPPHPEYVSGHAAFSGAAARVLGAAFGDQTAFSATSETLPGVVRAFTSFQACAEEIARSRVLAGIHFDFSGRAGLKLGNDVAGETLARFDLRANASEDAIAASGSY